MTVSARGGELRSAHLQVLAGHHLGRQVQPAQRPGCAAAGALAVVGEQFRRPDLRMEGDVVLAHEVELLRVVVAPPVLPGIGVRAVPSGPLDRGRQVADDRVEPDVELLVRSIPPAVERNRDAPVDVAGHGPRPQVVEQVQRELQHVGAPVVPGPQPVAQCAGQSRQIEEEVLGLDERRGLAVDPRPRVDQVDRVELIAAVVALVAAGAVDSRRSGRCPRCSGPGRVRPVDGEMADIVTLRHEIAIAVKTVRNISCATA